MNRFTGVLLTSLLILLPHQLSSQQEPAAEKNSGEQETAAETTGTAALPQLTDPFLVSVSGAAIEAGETDTQARFRFGIPTHLGSFAATVSTPLDKTDGVTELASLDGLSDSLALKLSYSRFVGVVLNKALDTELLEYCEREHIPNEMCDDNNIEEEFPGKLHGFLLHKSFENRFLQIFSLDAAAGRRETEYLRPDSGEKVEENKTPWSAGLGWGVLGDTWFFGGKVRYERKFMDGDEVQICNPVNVLTPLEECTTAPLGVPSEIEGAIASLGSRVFFRELALAPSVNFDLETDVLGIEVPIYFLRSKKQFTGGLALGWRSDTDDVTASIFVSKPISLK